MPQQPEVKSLTEEQISVLQNALNRLSQIKQEMESVQREINGYLTMLQVGEETGWKLNAAVTPWRLERDAQEPE